LGVVGVFGVLAEMRFHGLQDRGVRQGFDPGAERLIEFECVEIAFGELRCARACAAGGGGWGSFALCRCGAFDHGGLWLFRYQSHPVGFADLRGVPPGDAREAASLDMDGAPEESADSRRVRRAWVASSAFSS
jgi:hypothetical protein